MPATQPTELERRFHLILKEHGMSLEAAEGTVASVIRSKARTVTPEQLADAVQQTWLGILNYANSGVRIDSLEGLLVTIAKRQAYATYPRKDRRSVSIDDESDPVELSRDDTSRNEVRRRMFMMREFLCNASPGCLEVLDLLHEGYDLKEIADRLGKGYAAIRKGWSRCMELIRDAFAAGGDASTEWARLFS